jgi:hypothetical protein
LLPSLSLSSRFSVLKREAARHHLLILSRRNPSFLFVNTNAVASTVGRALLVFSKKIKKMPTSTPPDTPPYTPPYTRKNSGMLLHPDFFNGPGDVGMS